MHGCAMTASPPYPHNDDAMRPGSMVVNGDEDRGNLNLHLLLDKVLIFFLCIFSNWVLCPRCCLSSSGFCLLCSSGFLDRNFKLISMLL